MTSEPTFNPAVRRTHHKRRGTPAAPPTPVNANVVRVFLSFEQAVVVVFDGPVTVDQASPPTTWSFAGITSVQPGGGFDMGNAWYLALNGAPNPGTAVVIAANDPAARTPSGGYVNAATLTIEDI